MVIEIVNDLIVDNYEVSTGQAVIMQNQIIELFNTKCRTPFKMPWLDLEPLYEKYGWNVKYDKKDYSSMVGSLFIFTKIKNNP